MWLFFLLLEKPVQHTIWFRLNNPAEWEILFPALPLHLCHQIRDEVLIPGMIRHCRLKFLLTI